MTDEMKEAVAHMEKFVDFFLDGKRENMLTCSVSNIYLITLIISYYPEQKEKAWAK